MTEPDLMHRYSAVEGLNLVVCLDCGATGPTENHVNHYKNCQPGSSDYWAAYYSADDDDDGSELYCMCDEPDIDVHGICRRCGLED